ncbi:hypothetical protein FCN18_16895 [Prauserella endophytica]|uniref:Amidohydrolase-related domain-containing protein n=1 Tax=Prauserella endophytica TaxID=1592324 RepID=A0ABY2S592_9PSEU|nr:hypothetical protein FCN18_16895 [Prauserella endophytica]
MGGPSVFEPLARAGLLGPDQVHIHCNTLTDERWRILADSGVKVSISVETELNMGMGRPVFAKCEEFGVKPTLSCDVVSLNSGDLITQARMGLAFKRWADTEHLNLSGKDVEQVSTTALQALEWATINGAEACGLDDIVGSITVGKKADLIMAGGQDMALHPVIDAPGTLIYQTKPSDIRHVMVAGRFVKRDGVLVDHDLPTLLVEADRSAQQILARIRAASRDLPGKPRDGFDDLAEAMRANLWA